MRPTFAKLAIIALFVTAGRAEDSCDDGPFAPGQVSGEPFPAQGDNKIKCVCRWKGGDYITGIEAWSTHDRVDGVRLKYEMSGWTEVQGIIPEKPVQTARTEWSSNDRISIHLFNNRLQDGTMNAPAMIQVHRGEENIFQVGAASKRTSFPEIPNIDQGEGIILGFKSRIGEHHLNSIEFKMLKLT